MSKTLLSSRLWRAALPLVLCTVSGSSQAQTALADQPVFSGVTVPGNLALALSVEFPTAVSQAHTDSTYSPNNHYLGYFDPYKCYDYVFSEGYFKPAGSNTTHVCSNKWSGNFLNWATMQTIDPFRWVLTGGYRVVDEVDRTILEKAWFPYGQGGDNNFPQRVIDNQTIMNGATPLGWSGIKTRVRGMGNRMLFTRRGDNYAVSSGTRYVSNNISDQAVWELFVRVQVCDNSPAAGGAEANCKQYGSNWKPEGLIQQYSQQMRFSAFGYLNDGSVSRDGGVLRARQKYVGPVEPVPGGDDKPNPVTEWDASTGVMALAPDRDDAKAYGVAVGNTGVMNYLNKFGEINRGDYAYKTYDPVGELYYATLRYFRNLGNVPEWTNASNVSAATRVTYADGFPVITDWADPIQYRCQKNFVLGIGDVNTHADRNVPGGGGNSEPSMPAAVKADTTFNSVTWTNKVGVLTGWGSNLGTVQEFNGCCTNNGALMAGMAYWANSQDIRPDTNLRSTQGKQSIKTYWLDVLEYGNYKTNNQFYLATKYGGANLPDNFDALGRTTDLTKAWWHSGADSDTVGGQLRPDNYYTASKADQMVSGLTTAFASIASEMTAFTSSFNTASNEVVSSGEASYATLYDSTNWSGDIVASSATLGDTISYAEAWRFSGKLTAQATGTGWNTGRYIVTWNNGGVPFRIANISSNQVSALNTTYVSGNDSANYLNYLRGDRTDETGTIYRVRTNLVGDIANAKVTVIGPPNFTLSEAANPGYAQFKMDRVNRPKILVAGSNAGMVHVINGSLTGADAGKELFAYVPAAAFSGPNGTPSVSGLAAVGNPNYTHRYLVDAPPVYGDVDFSKTAGGSGTNNWRTIVVGGLGKGGRSIYALDVTDPTGINTEAGAATRVLWEYTETNMGFTFGEPVITKTAQYGWVVIVGSGYNNNNGKGYFYILNARTGALLQKVALPTNNANAAANDDGTTASPTGLAYIQTYYRDVTDLTVESVYAGDLRGSLWRMDLTATSGSYPTPVKIAKLTDSNGNNLAVTTRPLPIIQPGSNRRWITVGTGKLLNTTDISNNQPQRFYAITDGYQAKFNSAADLPSGMTFPLTTSNLIQLTDLTQAITINFQQKLGWYVDLGVSGGGSGYRVLTDPTSYVSTVSFASTLPTSEDPCSPSGTSRIYAIDLGTGVTQFVNNAVYKDVPFAVSDLRFVRTQPSGEVKLTYSGDPANDGSVPLKDPLGLGNRLINWREVPLRN